MRVSPHVTCYLLKFSENLDIGNSHDSSPSILGRSPGPRHRVQVRHDTGIIHAHSFGADHKYIARFK